MCVVKGSNDFRVYTEENLKDPEIKALAKRVRLEVDDQVQAMFPQKRAVRVTVKLKDGTSYEERLEGARGTPVNPMPRGEVEDKFRDLASVVLPDARIEEIIKVVEDLVELRDITALSKLLAA
jgi:2-methylcitrate dehydratase PrpD